MTAVLLSATITISNYYHLLEPPMTDFRINPHLRKKAEQNGVALSAIWHVLLNPETTFASYERDRATGNRVARICRRCGDQQQKWQGPWRVCVSALGSPKFAPVLFAMCCKSGCCRVARLRDVRARVLRRPVSNR